MADMYWTVLDVTFPDDDQLPAPLPDLSTDAGRGEARALSDKIIFGDEDDDIDPHWTEPTPEQTSYAELIDWALSLLDRGNGNTDATWDPATRTLHFEDSLSWGISNDDLAFPDTDLEAIGATYVLTDDGGKYEDGRRRTYSPETGASIGVAIGDGTPVLTVADITELLTLDDTALRERLTALVATP